MSQQFYEKFLNILFGFVVFLVLLIANTEFLILYLLNPTNQVYYYGYLVLLCVSALFGIRYYREYRQFRETLKQGLFCPSDVDRLVNSFDKPEPLEFDVEDEAVKVCLWYRNGAALTDIQKNLGLKHPNQARRELLKGLDILLRFYREHKELRE